MTKPAVLSLGLCLQVMWLLSPAAARDLPSRSLLASGPVTACPQLVYGATFAQGQDLKYVDNVASPAACCTQCGLTTGCMGFVYISNDGTALNSGAVQFRCHLKAAVGPMTNLDGGVAGIFNLTAAAAAFPDFNVGVDHPGNDITMFNNIPSSRACANICAAYPGCQAFSYVDYSDPNNLPAATAQNCYLKSAASNASPYTQLTGGVATGQNVAPAYHSMVTILSHSADEKDIQGANLEGFFLPDNHQDPNNPGSAQTTSAHLPRVFLLPQLQVGNAKQVDWYIHLPSTQFLDPNHPPLPPVKTSTVAPYYLGSDANQAGGQGTTLDLQTFRFGTAQACGSPINGSKCTLTAVATLSDGSKFITARATFFVSVIQSS